jgi:hypothetical protein
MSSMRVEGEFPLSSDLKGVGVWCSGTFWAEDIRCLLLSCPPLEPGNHGHRSAPRKPPGLVWCNSLLSLVVFR